MIQDNITWYDRKGLNLVYYSVPYCTIIASDFKSYAQETGNIRKGNMIKWFGIIEYNLVYCDIVYHNIMSYVLFWFKMA